MSDKPRRRIVRQPVEPRDEEYSDQDGVGSSRAATEGLIRNGQPIPYAEWKARHLPLGSLDGRVMALLGGDIKVAGATRPSVIKLESSYQSDAIDGVLIAAAYGFRLMPRGWFPTGDGFNALFPGDLISNQPIVRYLRDDRVWRRLVTFGEVVMIEVRKGDGKQYPIAVPAPDDAFEALKVWTDGFTPQQIIDRQPFFSHNIASLRSNPDPLAESVLRVREHFGAR